MSFDIGSAIWGYEILDLAESFGFGRSFKVRNPRFERVELLKILDRASNESREERVRFLREAEILSKLSHPCIIDMYDASIHENHIVMTLEYIQGTPLRKRIDRSRLESEQVLELTCQILSALELTHGHGVVHRSISPDTIVLTDSSEAKLTGFCYARMPAFQAVTNRGNLIGHFLYVAPEQIDNAVKVDPRADLYSVGALLFDLLTGRPPFWGTDIFTIMQGHLAGVPPTPSSLNPQLPAELDRIVLKSLAKRPVDRFQSAEEFRNALLRIDAGQRRQPLMDRGFSSKN